MPSIADPKLAWEIRVLSTMLYAGGNYWWPSTYYSEGEDTKLFSYIATLLGMESDMPVAVTGTVTPGNVSATVVCSRRQDQPLEQQVLESNPVKLSNRNIKEILDDKSTPPGLEAYIADLIALFGAVECKIVSGTAIIEWVIYRGWSKLRTCLKRSKTDFQRDIFDSMEAWSPNRYDDITSHKVLMPKTSSVYDKYTFIATHTDKGTTFVLNEETASLLAATIAQVFKDIRKSIMDPEVDRSQAASSLVDSFVWLHVILNNKHVEVLLTETSLRFALVPRWPEGNIDEPSDGWEHLPGCKCIRETYYGLRYMRMLVACATAVLRLDTSKLRPLFAATDTTIVSLVIPVICDVESECRSVAQELSDAMVQDPSADPGWDKAISKSAKRSGKIGAIGSGTPNRDRLGPSTSEAD